MAYQNKIEFRLEREAFFRLYPQENNLVGVRIVKKGSFYYYSAVKIQKHDIKYPDETIVSCINYQIARGVGLNYHREVKQLKPPTFFLKNLNRKFQQVKSIIHPNLDHYLIFEIKNGKAKC